jgi:osmoprotectant transport system ATP-binding protein
MPSGRLFERIDSVKLEKVSKKYGQRYAVEDLTLEIIGGELLILIGPSGSGKTTALRMINRLVESESGRITINERNVLDLDPVELRRNIGYVIQQIGLFPHMTVSENIGLIPRFDGWDEEKIRKKVEELLKLVALPPETFMDRYPKELSGGQQQRVGLARALAMDPRLLLMDEPFGALDPLLRKQLQDEFLQIKGKLGRTIVFVTHDIEEAFKLGDRVAVINEGRLIQVGKPDELILEPANDFVAEIVDSERKFKHMNHLLVKDLMTPLKALEKENLGELVKKRSFDPNDSLTSALSELKKAGESIAVVKERDKPVGMLLADEVLLRLI